MNESLQEAEDEAKKPAVQTRRPPTPLPPHRTRALSSGGRVPVSQAPAASEEPAKKNKKVDLSDE